MTYPPDGSDTTIRDEKIIEIKNGKVGAMHVNENPVDVSLIEW